MKNIYLETRSRHVNTSFIIHRLWVLHSVRARPYPKTLNYLSNGNSTVVEHSTAGAEIMGLNPAAT